MNTYFLWIMFIFMSYNNRLLAGPDIVPIEDVIACSYYVLPPITGSGLTSNAAYFNNPNGTGSTYIAGDTIFTSSILYAYDADGTGSDEECFYIQIINQLPDLSNLGDTASCEYFVLPYFATPGISGFAGYYTAPDRQGIRYPQGDTLFASQILYAYDGYEGCNVEQVFAVTIFEKPLFDSIPTQYGCHDYTLIPFAGQNVFADSMYFYFNGQSYVPGDIIDMSGTVEVIAKNGACMTIEDFDLVVVDEIIINPIADTFTCEHYLILPEILGTNVTNNARFYEQSNGIGEAYEPLDVLSIPSDGFIYAYDKIPGTDCEDEEFFYVDRHRESWAYNDFTITVCKGLSYDTYELLLRRQIHVHLNRIVPIDPAVELEENKFFNTLNYPEGSYLFYVIDTAASVCIPDTAIMTVISSSQCTNTDYTDSVCIEPHVNEKLIMANLVESPWFCVGGYFTDLDFNFIGNWNDLYLLNASVEHDFEFYYILQDPFGNNDTSSILIKIVRYKPVIFSGAAILCKGDCTNLKISFLDDDYYLSLLAIRSSSSTEIMGFLFDSLTRSIEIPVCYLNRPHNQHYENPDTIILNLANEEYEFDNWALELKDCQSYPEPIIIKTLEENTLHYTETLCLGDEVTFDDQTFNQTRPVGEILLDEPAFNGCDSFLYVQLTFYDSAIHVLKEEICDDDTVIINCIAYSSAFSKDTQIISGGSKHGCDSIIIIDLNFTQPDTLTIDTVLCPDQFVVISQQIFDTTGIYEGVIKKQNLCDSLIFNLDLSYSPSPPIQLSLPGNICHGDTGVVSITSMYASLQWSTGDTSDQITITEPGAYGISITTTSGCVIDTTFHINISEGPEVTGIVSYQTSINKPVIPELIFSDSLTIKWTPSTGLDCDTCLYPVITTAEPQVYQFVVTDMNGCQLTGSITIEVLFDTEADIYIPTIINPASENEENRMFSIFTKGVGRPYTMSIFDRWGSLLYSRNNLLTNNSATGWNGRIENKPVLSGVYTYKIIIEGVSDPLTGTITVIY